jgi:hypothetical protein
VSVTDDHPTNKDLFAGAPGDHPTNKDLFAGAPGVDPCVLVYDVGGSHISAAVCFKQGFRLGTVVRANQPEEQTSEAFVEVLHSLGMKAGDGVEGVEGAELAMPGPFDYAQGISWMKHKMPFLYGVNVSEAMAARFGWKAGQVRFLNDAAAYLLGEVGAGAARVVKRVVVFTLGTGVGSGFAVDGNVVTEGKGVPPGGEIWNVPYEGGIVEDQISTGARGGVDRALRNRRRSGVDCGLRGVRQESRNRAEEAAGRLCSRCGGAGRRDFAVGVFVSVRSKGRVGWREVRGADRGAWR